jgi:ATP-dependent helicase HrpB
MSAASFPIDTLREAFEALDGPVVVTSPTGSGKSTRVPLWCEPPVLVVEPRRVAARSLATFLGGARHGDTGRHIVRGEHRAHDETGIVYATTGVALQMLASGDLSRFQTVVLDEFHERTLELDLLYALVQQRARLVVLSATIDGDRIAAHLGGAHLTGQGRTHPVDIRYSSADRTLPDPDRLPERVRAALESVADHPGDRLVFVPGKAEIERVRRGIEGLGLEVLPLHGGLSLSEQSRAFRESGPARVVVATNVAETSITLPRTRVVIDSGLVRRTQYTRDRGYLALLPIAQDSADQRSGRAGRTAPGIAVRLWGAHAPLAERTPPAMNRESLVPLVLGAAAANSPGLDLPFVDAPPEHAVVTARAHLLALGALDDAGITDRGRRLFGLPLDVRLGRLLVEAESRGTLPRVIDLVAALGVGRLFEGGGEEDLREAGCDGVALMRAMQSGDPREHGLNAWALREARREAGGLRATFECAAPQGTVDRRAVVDTLLAAWPDCVHVARRRGKRVGWSNGGTEIQLSHRSFVPEEAEIIAVLDTVALGQRSDAMLLATAAMPVEAAWVIDAGIGRERLGHLERKRGSVMGHVDRVHAGKVLGTELKPLTGTLAREAVATLFLRGSIFDVRTAKRRFERTQLAAQLDGDHPSEGFEDWVHRRIAELGVESGEDLALLSTDDLMPDALPEQVGEELDRDFPSTVELGALRFRVEVEVGARRVTLHNLGARIGKLPPASWLPRFRGWSVRLEDRNTHRWLRRPR